MAYQVIARKYRPQKFDDVLGQRGVTQTLRNALASGRLAHAFVFAGARGVGKTTTARILARALNCVEGPTPEPCGTCEACVEIAEGRDMDVLEIDAATHTGVDHVRDVIIDGLGIRPVRDRYKIFIIDEVHQLSSSSFNALLKSLEEPPPHVIFMMATTELNKIPETITSRSQVYEFKTISQREIVGQLRDIATKEHVAADEAALALVARAAEGSMRDAQSAFDQVIAFAGDRITADDVRSVLGLIGRDVLLDVVEIVADENAAAVFDVAARLVESGQDLRLVCRELSRLVRDLMVLSIDPKRASDPEFAIEGDPARMEALVERFSREDLLRSFDLLAKAESDLRYATQPRHHLEMALLRWIHVRKLTPLTELMEALSQGSLPSAKLAAPAEPSRPSRPAAPAPPTRSAAERFSARAEERVEQMVPPAGPQPTAAATTRPAAVSDAPATNRPPAGRPPTSPAPPQMEGGAPSASRQVALDDPEFRDAFIEEVRRGRKAFAGMVIGQARRITVGPDRIVIAFSRSHQTLYRQLEQQRPWLEALVEQMAGRKVPVVGEFDDTVEPAVVRPKDERTEALKAKAMDQPVVQAMFDVFPAEIRDIEEIDK
ncbi:MAG: DNA polymerase III subunit gamma/tau [Vicinamibacterales bacterium]